MNKIWLKNLARLYLPVYQYESAKYKLAYAGYSSIKRNYYSRFILGSDLQYKLIGRKWFWEIPRLLKSQNLDLVVSEIGQLSMSHFQNRHGLILPEWALMRINIDRPLSEIKRRSVSDFADVVRLIRKYKLTYEILNGREDFDYFMDNLYRPYITKRYGEEAWIEDLTKIWNSDPSPFLLVIRENGEIVGASLNRITDSNISLLRLGLLDGNDEYRRHGTIGAIYYFSMVEGQKNNCKYLDVGGTRPFLTHGLTKFKLGLGAEFVTECYAWRDYHWIGANENSEWALDFLNKNPAMHLNKDHKLVLSEIK